MNKVEVIYNCESAKGSVLFAAGLVKRRGVTSYSDKDNRLVSLWGLTTEKEEQGYLGMGIVMPKDVFKGIKEDKVHVMTCAFWHYLTATIQL